MKYTRKSETKVNLRLNSHCKDMCRNDSPEVDQHFKRLHHYFSVHIKFKLIHQLLDLTVEKQFATFLAQLNVPSEFPSVCSTPCWSCCSSCAVNLMHKIHYLLYQMTIYAAECHVIKLHEITGIWFLHDLFQSNLCKRFPIITTDSLFSEWGEIKWEALQDSFY